MIYTDLLLYNALSVTVFNTGTVMTLILHRFEHVSDIALYKKYKILLNTYCNN